MLNRSRSPIVRLALCFWALLALPANVSAAEGKIALTFDDLPALTILSDQAYVDYLNATIVRKLRRHRIPAIGFVNEGKIDELVRDRQIANLERWLDAGLELGNHTYSHESLNAVGPEAFVGDIARGEPIITWLLLQHQQPLRYFRHPYLETGATTAVKRQVDDWLNDHGYRIAPVTIDPDDWEFAEPYDDAIARKDRKQQRHIKAEYLAYTARRVDWAQRSARALFGRDIAQVMLLHCTRLNADTLDKLARVLRRAHLTPATLAEALKDPAYRQLDPYVGRDGIDWLERWAAARHRQLPEQGNEDPPPDIQTAYDRVDNDRN